MYLRKNITNLFNELINNKYILKYDSEIENIAKYYLPSVRIKREKSVS